MKTMLSLLVLSGAILAQDFETSYHEAYVLEVIDGKVAVAAKRYLSLLRDPKLPAHLQIQCRFRFAVTCVVLGRADEARARLAALAADPATPKALQPQIEEYFKSLTGVGAGSELDKKLDALKAKLANWHPETRGHGEAEYRQFEVIGKPAIPYLRRMFRHRDLKMRVHAFKLLCRLDEPGLAEEWEPILNWGWPEFEAYLVRHPAELRVMERRLAALDDKVLGPILAYVRKARFSAAFLEKLSKRPIAPRLVPHAARLADKASSRKLIERWIREGSPELVKAAAAHYASLPDPSSELLGPVFKSLAPGGGRVSGPGLGRMVADATPEARMQLLKDLIAMGEKAPPVLTGGMVDLLASAIDKDEFDVPAYETLLRRWIAVLAKSGRHKNTVLYWHVRAVLKRLPEARAVAWVREIVRLETLRYVDPFMYRDAGELPWIRAALESATPDKRQVIAYKIVEHLHEATPFYRRDMAKLYARIVELHEPDDLHRPLREFRHVALDIPDPAPAAPDFGRTARAVADSLVDVVVRRAPSTEEAAIAVSMLFYPDADRERALESRYLRNIAIPLLEPLTRKLAKDEFRSAFADMAYGILVLNVRGAWKLGDAHATLLAYVRNNMAHVTGWGSFKDVVHLIPSEFWMPYAPDSVYFKLPQPVIDAAARRMVDDWEAVNPYVMEVLRGPVSNDVAAQVFADLLEKVDGPRLAILMQNRNPLWTAPPATLEGVLDRSLGDPQYTLASLVPIGNMLAEQRPTRKLYPLVKRLLMSESPTLALEGVHAAERLGQPDLLPDLAKLLDSLSPNVRDAAKEAMMSIRDLEELRNR